jgi:hypothetical protein
VRHDPFGYAVAVTNQQADRASGHVFISYVREDTERVDRLQRILEVAGITVWRDTDSLWPGQDWKIEIRKAISTGSLVFIACFSEHSGQRESSYQNEELILAVDLIRRRPPGLVWFIPVRFSNCKLPEFELGPGRTLDALQRVDLFGDFWDEGASRLVAAVHRILGSPSVVTPGVAPRAVSEQLNSVLLDTTPPFEEPPKSGLMSDSWWTGVSGIATVIGTIVGVGSLGLAAWLAYFANGNSTLANGSPSGPRASSTSTSGPAPTPNHPLLPQATASITSPAPGSTVGLCFTARGTSSNIPADKALWLVVLSPTKDDTEPTSVNPNGGLPYVVEKIKVPASGAWTAHRRQLGDPSDARPYWLDLYMADSTIPVPDSNDAASWSLLKIATPLYDKAVPVYRAPAPPRTKDGSC